MKTLLKITTVLLFLLSVAAFVLGLRLYEDREVLKGRTQKLESALVALAATFETDFTSLDRQPSYPERDIDAVTAELIDKPELGEFWAEYVHSLELHGSGTMEVTPRYAELISLYKWDPIKRRPMRDPVTGLRVITGPGTMQNLLNEVVATAEDQLDRLGRTRDELAKIRQEHVGTINDLNENKSDLRVALNTVKVRGGTIVALESDVQKRDEEIVAFKSNVQDLTDQIGDKERELADRDEQVDEMERELKYYKDNFSTRGGGGTWTELSTGQKGRVASVNREWNFVLVDLSEEFVRVYSDALGKGKKGLKPELSVMRKEQGEDVFVGKVQLSEVRIDQNIGVGNILRDWQEKAFREGDRVIYF